MIGTTQIYIAIAIIVLGAIVVSVVYVVKNEEQRKPSKLAYAALLSVILGMFFENSLIAYSLMGAGVLLAAIGIVRDLRATKESGRR